MQKFRDLTRVEKRTFKFHLSYTSIQGFILGVFAMNEFVFIKSMDAADYQLSTLFSFSMGVFVLLVFTNEFLKRVSNKKKLLIRTAFVTRLPFLIFLLFPRSLEEIAGNEYYHYIFLGVFLIFYLGQPIIMPSVNQFLKNTYRHENFGRLFGYATTVNKIFTLVTTFLFGLLLDFDNYAFEYVYPLMGGLGILSVYLLSRIDYKETYIYNDTLSIFSGVKKSVKRMYRILKTDKPYFYFQVGFMLYGLAFMISYPVINLFFGKDGLDLTYSSVAFYKNAANITAILFLPVFGKILGKMDPRKFGAFSLFFLLLYFLFLAMTVLYPSYVSLGKWEIYYAMIVAFIFSGLFMSTMHLLWSIGSAYFCKKEDAGIYQSVHLSLTGFRAMFAPALGIFVYLQVGFLWTYIIGIILLLVGILFLLYSYFKHKIIHNP